MAQKRFANLLAYLIFMLLLSPTPYSQAQDSGIILSLVIPSTQKARFSDELIAAFEFQHPGVTIHLVNESVPILESDVTNTVAYLDALFDYVIRGDVLFVYDGMMSPVATQAGYFLDLTPLMAADRNLNAETYYPALWDSYQWDNGLWALPYSGIPVLLGYDVSLFDAAGVTYPTTDWSLEQFAIAARALTQYDANGSILAPGLVVSSGSLSEQALLRTLLGERLYDNTTVPNTPRINTDEIEEFVEIWATLQTEGVIASRAQSGYSPAMQIGNLSALGQPTPSMQWMLLPGNQMYLQSQAFVVNASTNYPELAYSLATFLSSRPEIVGTDRISAMRNLVDNTGSVPQQQTTIQAGLESGLPFKELLYINYLVQALNLMHNPDANAAEILANSQLQSLDAQRFATEYKATHQLYVTPPGAPPGLRPGEVMLHFGFSTLFPPQQVPNQALWDQVVAEFVDTDPEVGYIDMVNVQLESLDTMAETYDCFTSLFNLADPSTIGFLLNLDPLLNADATFNANDLMGDALEQVTIDNRIWGIPLTIQAGMITYNKEQLIKEVIPFPEFREDVNDFRAILERLFTDKSIPPFWPSGGGKNYVLPLIAAYGGLPIDYRTNPPTINFTSPENMAAIEAAFRLAKEGYIYYLPLIQARITGVHEWYDPPLNDLLLEHLQLISSSEALGYMAYPAGSQYRGLPFSLTVGYISARAEYPEACYRWLSFIRTQPELTQGMPVYRSLLDSPVLLASRGDEIVNLYQALSIVLDDPETIRFPLFEEEIVTGMLFVRYWLYDAIDRYVLEDLPLENILPQAQAQTEAFLLCANNLPSMQSSFDRLTQLVACVRQVDANFVGF